MARPVKIFADVSQGRIFFFGSRVPAAPLGGAVLAIQNPNRPDFIRVTREDKFQRDGVTPRRLYKRLNPSRVKNKEGQFLVSDLGFSLTQVVDYINDQANKKSNEIDILKDGALVGGGTTINFVGGGLTTLTVVNDIVTVGIVSTVESDNIVGLITTGQIQNLNASQLTGVVGTGNLPITSLGGVNFVPGESDSTPAFDLSDAHSYPYSSLVGVPTTGHNTTINEFLYYQQYLTPGAGFSTSGPGITSTNPPEQNNPYYYGTQLKPYQEMVWTHSMSGTGAYWVGKWNGNTTYTPTTAGNVANWERVLVFRNSNADGHHIDNAGTSLDSQGFGFGPGVTQYTTINNNVSFMRLRYNGDTNKLEIYRGSNTPIGIATANLAEDGNPITISFAISDNDNVHLPGITTVQYYVDQTKWKYHNSNESLENSTHDIDKGVVYWGEPLHKGEELMFSIPGNSAHIGIWNGGTGVTGSDNVRNKTNWSTKWQYNHNRTDWEAATASHGATGVQMAKDIQVDNGTYAIRYDYQTEKLQLWEIDGSGDWLLSNANSALVGVTTQYIYFSKGGDNTGGDSLPSVTHRGQDFTLTSYTDSTRPGPSFYDGTKVNDVWKSNRAFKSGLKLKFTVPTTAGNQYWATAFEGTEDLGNGENNSYQAGEMTWRLTNQEKFNAHEDCTLNTNYTAIDGSSALSLPGRNMSWRYNSDNNWDLFDEDTDEVVLTGDDVLSGDVYPYLLAVNNSDDVLSDYVQYEWEWNKKAWFMEYRDWDPSDNSNTWLILTANGHALQEATASQLYNVTWCEKMRPGQEFAWTQLNTNQNGSTKNNMIIGVLDSTYRTYTAGVKFYRGGFLKHVQDQDAGFTQTGVGATQINTAGTSVRLRYELGTNKLVCYSLNAGVRTKLAESTSALDGNPIFISMGGDSTRLPVTSGVEVYGWEFAHTPSNHYNPWNNWRVEGFPANVVGLTTGNHSTAVTIPRNTVLRHKDGLPQGYQMKWTTAVSSTGNPNIGVWKTSNATSGLTDVTNPIYWNFSFETGGDEDIDSADMVGMTINTSNSNYDLDGGNPEWQDPSPGSTQIGFRYHSNNTIDLYDFTGSEVIATVNDTQDGNPVYISWGAENADFTTASDWADDFFGGGDVSIATTTN